MKPSFKLSTMQIFEALILINSSNFDKNSVGNFLGNPLIALEFLNLQIENFNSALLITLLTMTNGARFSKRR